MLVVGTGGVFAVPKIGVGQIIFAVRVSTGSEEDADCNCCNDNYCGYYEYQKFFHIIVRCGCGRLIHIFAVPFKLNFVFILWEIPIMQNTHRL